MDSGFSHNQPVGLKELRVQVHNDDLPVATTPGLAFRSLPYREIKRRFWHMAPGFLAFGLHIFPHADPITWLMRTIIIGCCSVIGLRIFYNFQQIQRQGEGAGVAAVCGYAFSVLFMCLLYPQDLELGLAVLSILAFGDGSATLFGLMLRGPRLPWNQAKSWSGLLAFIGVGSLMTAWIYWGETHNPEAAEPAVSFGMALALTMPAVVSAAIAESIRSKINDNVRVGVIAAVVLALVHNLR